MSSWRNIPNPEKCSRHELETAIKEAVSARERDRLHAIKALLLDAPFHFVCELYGLSERSLRRWICAFNLQGIYGLIDNPRHQSVIRPHQQRLDRQQAHLSGLAARRTNRDIQLRAGTILGVGMKCAACHRHTLNTIAEICTSLKCL